MTDSESFFQNEEEQNNNEGQQFEGTFPCPLCNLRLEIRRSKNRKPYCVCNSCGLQLFIRGKKGIEKLKALSEDLALSNTIEENEQDPEKEFYLETNRSRKAITILSEIELLEKKIKEIEDGVTFWESVFGGDEKERVLSILNQDLEKLKDEIKKI